MVTSSSNSHDSTIQSTYPRQLLHRQKRTFSEFSHYGLTVPDDDSTKIDLQSIQHTIDGTTELYQSPIDEHHDSIDGHRQNQLSYLTELYYQNSPQRYGSPVTKDGNMASRYTTEWEMTMAMPRPLDFAEVLDNDDHVSAPVENRNIKRQRTFDFFTLDENTTDGSYFSAPTPLTSLSSQPQRASQELGPTQTTSSSQSNDAQNERDLLLEYPYHPRQLQIPSPSPDDVSAPLRSTETSKYVSMPANNWEGVSMDQEGVSHDKTERNLFLATKSVNGEGNVDTKSSSQQTRGENDCELFSKENLDYQRLQIETDLLEQQHETESDLQQQFVRQNDITEQLYSQHSYDQHTLSNGEHQHTTDQTSIHSRESEMTADQQRLMNKQLQEMNALMESVETLCTHYRLLKKVGCGTFSSVYKAQDILYNYNGNTMWKESSDANTSRKERSLSTTSNQQKYVAIKQIYSTSSPKRMAHEIKILQHLRGAPYVCQLITAFRSNEHVFLVMPYFQHIDFKYYCRGMDLGDTKHYMTTLLAALKYLHDHGIVHRDIKPNNFLYDKEQKTGMLIDFGLAQMEAETKPPDPPKSHRRQRSLTPASPTTLPFRASKNLTFKSTNELNKNISAKPGYLKHDKRKSVRASRAGTRGFRAPEVLLRVSHQTVAIDIWSVGVILLSLLSGRYPFFIAYDESDSLIEIASIFGMKEMKDCAALHNRTFETNIETIPSSRKSLFALCKILNTEKFKLWAQDDKQKLDYAIDLLKKMLTLNYKARITAEDALKHPFLSDTLL